MSDAAATGVVEYCTPANSPAPAGHYSPAAAFGDLVYISGQLPDVPQGRSVSFEAQVESAMQRVFSALASAGVPDTDLVVAVQPDEKPGQPPVPLYADPQGYLKLLRSLVAA